MTHGQAEVRFGKPPVQHVVLTVFFEPIRALQVSHLSSLRELWREDYPNTAELPPLAPRNRGGEESRLAVPVRGAWPFPYLMFSDEDEQQVIAVQNDRLVRTWTFAEGRPRYPGFAELSGDLNLKLQELAEVIREETDEVVVPTGSECFYDNLLPDLPMTDMMVGVATQWVGSASGAELPTAHYAGVRIHVDSADHPQCGVELSLDVNRDDDTYLGITSHYQVAEDEEDGALELGGLGIAHGHLIEQFLAFTNETMQAGWEREG